MTILNIEIDQPWKVAITLYLEPFLSFCFPAVHKLVDWSFAPESLDKELPKITSEHREGVKVVDKLFKLRMRSGEDRMVLIHVEIQARPEGGFSLRMETYNYRLRDRFQWPAISLAVLVDDHPSWRPRPVLEKLGGCVRYFKYPMFKVLDAAHAEAEFEKSGNPFALLVAAQRAALLHRKNPEKLFEERFRFIRYLYRKGLKREDVLNLFRLIVWMTKLPPEMELKFEEKLHTVEFMEKELTIEDLALPWELRAREEAREEGQVKGREEGKAKGREEGMIDTLRLSILDALETHFGALPANVGEKVNELSDREQLRRALRLAVASPSLAEFLTAI